MRTCLNFLVPLAVTILAAGCVAVDRKYELSISHPVPELYFAEVKWQTDVDVFADPEWEKKAVEIALPAIRAEFERLGLPCDNISAGKPRPYRNAWVVFPATVGNLPEDELARKARQFWQNHPDGRPMPPSVHRIRGEFRQQPPHPTGR
jgi:hypothetical protein